MPYATALLVRPTLHRTVLVLGAALAPAVVCAQTPTVAITLSCSSDSGSLNLPLESEGLDYDTGSESYYVSIATSLANLPTLLSAYNAGVLYSTCKVTGGALPYTFTDATFEQTPGAGATVANYLKGITLAGAGAQASFNFDTLTVSGVTYSNAAVKKQAGVKKEGVN